MTDRRLWSDDAQPVWRRLDETLIHESPLEVRAEPTADGGWTIRAERTVGTPQGALMLGFLHQTVQQYLVEVS